IEGLAFRNALTLDTGIDFHHHADRLITGIGKAMDIAQRSRGLRKVPEPTASAANSRLLRKIVTWSAVILLTVAASALVVWYVATHQPEQAKPVVKQDSQPPVAKSATLNIASITREHPYVNSLGMKFVPVPGTKVLFSVW